MAGQPMDERLLISANHKLHRASAIFHNELRPAVDAYAAEAMKVKLSEHKERDERGRPFWTVNVLETLPQPDPTIALALGDTMHNNRAALDHLVCACVTAKGNKIQNHHLFPCRRTPPKGLPELDGMSAEHRAWFESWLPHQDPESQWAKDLLLIHDMDVIDKHRLLLTPVMVARADEVEVPAGTRMTVNREAVKEGDWVSKIWCPPGVEVWVPVAYDLALEWPNIRIPQVADAANTVLALFNDFVNTFRWP